MLDIYKYDFSSFKNICLDFLLILFDYSQKKRKIHRIASESPTVRHNHVT